MTQFQKPSKYRSVTNNIFIKQYGVMKEFECSQLMYYLFRMKISELDFNLVEYRMCLSVKVTSSHINVSCLLYIVIFLVYIYTYIYIYIYIYIYMYIIFIIYIKLIHFICVFIINNIFSENYSLYRKIQYAYMMH